MLGWAAEDVVGSFPPTVPEDEADRHRQFREEIAAGRTVQAHPSSRLRKDGTRIDVLVYGGPRRDAAGAVVGVVEMLADVTESRQLEQQLVQAQKIEGIGRLAGGVAHDFNNVLTAILGHADLLLYDLPADSPLVFHAESIREAGKRGAGLTAQLLAFSRQQVLQPRIIDLNEEVRASWALLRPLVGETIDFRVIARSDAGHIRADPTQLQQVILNLVVNARDAMPGGGRLTLESDSTEFSEAYAAEHFDVHPGRYAAVVVTDTGVGMDRETRQHIFEPFFTTKARGEGTGLGLATTYGIVRQSGGHIWLYSEPGLGTTFKIYFPQVTPSGEVVPLVSQPPIAHGTGTILLVEDEDDVREIERRALERYGYHVHVAVDGDDALRAANALGHEIDLLVTDVVMPGPSGPRVAAELRSERPDLPVLYLSGYAAEMMPRDEELAPNTAFLGKPFTPDALARRVRDLLLSRGGSDEAGTAVARGPQGEGPS